MDCLICLKKIKENREIITPCCASSFCQSCLFNKLSFEKNKCPKCDFSNPITIPLKYGDCDTCTMKVQTCIKLFSIETRIKNIKRIQAGFGGFSYSN
jgi:hypothetical protein